MLHLHKKRAFQIFYCIMVMQLCYLHFVVADETQLSFAFLRDKLNERGRQGASLGFPAYFPKINERAIFNSLAKLSSDHKMGMISNAIDLYQSNPTTPIGMIVHCVCQSDSEMRIAILSKYIANKWNDNSLSIGQRRAILIVSIELEINGQIPGMSLECLRYLSENKPVNKSAIIDLADFQLLKSEWARQFRVIASATPVEERESIYRYFQKVTGKSIAQQVLPIGDNSLQSARFADQLLSITSLSSEMVSLERKKWGERNTRAILQPDLSADKMISQSHQQDFNLTILTPEEQSAVRTKFIQAILEADESQYQQYLNGGQRLLEDIPAKDRIAIYEKSLSFNRQPLQRALSQLLAATPEKDVAEVALAISQLPLVYPNTFLPLDFFRNVPAANAKEVVRALLRRLVKNDTTTLEASIIVAERLAPDERKKVHDFMATKIREFKKRPTPLYYSEYVCG